MSDTLTHPNPPTATPRRHPDIFTAEEAVAYLHLESVRSLDTLRDEGLLTGHRPVGKGYLYHREDLDTCALKMFGKGSTKTNHEATTAHRDRSLRISGGAR